jgi:kinesin family protein 3/17
VGNFPFTACRHTDENLIGVIPRAIAEIFETSKSRDVLQCSIYCSFVQIYNENLYDMLRDSNMDVPLTIREDQQRKEIYVQGLSEYNVKSVADTLNLLQIAEENRAIRETHMNQFSSRSHSIFQIFVEQKRLAEDGGEIQLRAKFNLVDLAGSEKWNIRQQVIF